MNVVVPTPMGIKMLQDAETKHTNNHMINASHFVTPKDPVEITLFLPFCRKENLALEVLSFPKITLQLESDRIGLEL